MEYLELTVTKCGQWTRNREFICSDLTEVALLSTGLYLLILVRAHNIIIAIVNNKKPNSCKESFASILRARQNSDLLRKRSFQPSANRKMQKNSWKLILRSKEGNFSATCPAIYSNEPSTGRYFAIPAESN